MIRKWVKILPYFIVKRIAQRLEVLYTTALNMEFYVFPVDEGEYIMLTPKKYKEHLRKEQEKRMKKLEKARKKLRKILEEFPELRKEIVENE